jgi:glycerophosphoryl diester phosphodiesterase
MLVLVFGHRGARGEAPENTLAGFAHAKAAGVAAFELDVRLTADGRLAVIHDASVDRTTDGTGPVSAFTATELARLDARRGWPDWPQPAGVPVLEEVLDAYAGTMRFAIEIKRDASERLERVGALLVDQIARYRLRGRVTVTSFEPEALEIVRRLAPDVPRAYIGAYDTPDFLDAALRLECAQADIPLKTGSAEIVREAQARGLRVVGWQGNTPDDLAALVAWGVNGITSDYPSGALAYLRDRGIDPTRW